MATTPKKTTTALLPKEPISTHPIILDMAYRIWAKRDFSGFPPDPVELMQADLDYYDEVLFYAQIVDFARDETRTKEF